MLKMTGVQIEAMSEISHILFMEQNIRGGVSFINKRHTEEKYCDNQKAKKTSSSGGKNKKNVKLLFIDGNNEPFFPP